MCVYAVGRSLICDSAEVQLSAQHLTDELRLEGHRLQQTTQNTQRLQFSQQQDNQNIYKIVKVDRSSAAFSATTNVLAHGSSVDAVFQPHFHVLAGADV